jgi:hypothetical protein
MCLKTCYGANTLVPSDLLKLMQEPILTRWGTVGKACQYVERFRPVLIILAQGLCAITTTTSNLALCAGNFSSLSKEDEIRIDLAFLSDFDKYFFRSELDFSHLTDPNIGRAGFLGNHHLVRYFLKRQALKNIQEELNNGAMDQRPANATFKSFWTRMIEANGNTAAQNSSLSKARWFMDYYLDSLDKHNRQFVLSDLLFLAAFGEFETGTMVAQMLKSACKDNEPEPLFVELVTFTSAIHKQDINLEQFAEFLEERSWGKAHEAVEKSHFNDIV